MATDVIPKRVTVEEFLEIERNTPDDVHLELIHGEIREYPGMTTRSAQHSQTTARISHVLLTWLDDRIEREQALLGTVADGEARCRLNDEIVVGLDVAYFEGRQHVDLPAGQSYFAGPPVLAAEVLSPSDRLELVTEKIRLLLDAGVKQVWVVDPEFQTVIVHRSDAEPVLYSRTSRIPGDPELPGFQCPVSRLFASRSSGRSVQDK